MGLDVLLDDRFLIVRKDRHRLIVNLAASLHHGLTNRLEVPALASGLHLLPHSAPGRPGDRIQLRHLVRRQLQVAHRRRRNSDGLQGSDVPDHARKRLLLILSQNVGDLLPGALHDGLHLGAVRLHRIGIGRTASGIGEEPAHLRPGLRPDVRDLLLLVGG
jgi:hypothetical protein